MMFKAPLALLALVGSAFAAPSPQKGTAVTHVEKRDSSSGSATFYETGLGACGWNNGNQDMIVAVNSAQFNGGSHCGKWLTIQNNANGNTVSAYAADECPTCAWGSLDLSPQAFGQLNGFSELLPRHAGRPRGLKVMLMTDYDEGMFDITWWWNE